MPHTNYELSGHDMHANAAGGGGAKLTINDGDVTVNVLMTVDKTIKLQRNLRRIVDPMGGDDPTGHGYSIGDLMQTRKVAMRGELGASGQIEVIDAYIRLVEYVNREKEKKDA